MWRKSLWEIMGGSVQRAADHLHQPCIRRVLARSLSRRACSHLRATARQQPERANSEVEVSPEACHLPMLVYHFPVPVTAGSGTTAGRR
jgi:hypothetical protein